MLAFHRKYHSRSSALTGRASTAAVKPAAMPAWLQPLLTNSSSGESPITSALRGRSPLTPLKNSQRSSIKPCLAQATSSARRFVKRAPRSTVNKNGARLGPLTNTTVIRRARYSPMWFNLQTTNLAKRISRSALYDPMALKLRDRSEAPMKRPQRTMEPEVGVSAQNLLFL